MRINPANIYPQPPPLQKKMLNRVGDFHKNDLGQL